MSPLENYNLPPAGQFDLVAKCNLGRFLQSQLVNEYITVENLAQDVDMSPLWEY